MSENISCLYSSLLPSTNFCLPSFPGCPAYGCPVWPVATTSEVHNHLFPQYFWSCFQHCSIEDIREMLSIFLWDFTVTEITKRVRTPIFSSNKVVYTSTDSFFISCAIQSDTYILLLFKLSIRSLSEASGGCGMVKITWDWIFQNQFKKSENMKWAHLFDIK